MKRLQMAAVQRGRRPLQEIFLMRRTIKRFVGFMTNCLHLLGTPNHKVFGCMRSYSSTQTVSRKHSPPAASHFPPFTSSGVPLSRFRGHIISICLSCGSSFHCALNVISRASPLRNGGAFLATRIGSRYGQSRTPAMRASTSTLRDFGSMGDPFFLVRR